MKDYIQQAIRTECKYNEDRKLSPRIQHALDGLTTEVGEMVDMVKRFKYYGAPLDLVNLKEELGDLLWYVAVLCDELGVTFEEIQEANIAKLRARYPDKFTQDRALNRDTQKERDVLRLSTSEIDPAYKDTSIL